MKFNKVGWTDDAPVQMVLVIVEALELCNAGSLTGSGGVVDGRNDVDDRRTRSA